MDNRKRDVISSANPLVQVWERKSTWDTNFFKIHSNIAFTSRLGLPRGFFPIGLPVTIFKALLPSSILLILIF